MKLVTRWYIHKIVKGVVSVFSVVSLILFCCAFIKGLWSFAAVFGLVALFTITYYWTLVDSPVYNSAMLILTTGKPKSFNEAEELLQVEFEVSPYEARKAIQRYFRGE